MQKGSICHANSSIQLIQRGSKNNWLQFCPSVDWHLFSPSVDRNVLDHLLIRMFWPSVIWTFLPICWLHVFSNLLNHMLTHLLIGTCLPLYWLAHVCPFVDWHMFALLLIGTCLHLCWMAHAYPFVDWHMFAHLLIGTCLPTCSGTARLAKTEQTSWSRSIGNNTGYSQFIKCMPWGRRRFWRRSSTYIAIYCESHEAGNGNRKLCSLLLTSNLRFLSNIYYLTTTFTLVSFNFSFFNEAHILMQTIVKRSQIGTRWSSVLRNL